MNAATATTEQPETQKVVRRKRATIEAQFPELKGKYIYGTGRGIASTPKAAVSRAVQDLLKSVKAKRFTTIKATITIINVEDQ